MAGSREQLQVVLDGCARFLRAKELGASETLEVADASYALDRGRVNPSPERKLWEQIAQHTATSPRRGRTNRARAWSPIPTSELGSPFSRAFVVERADARPQSFRSGLWLGCSLRELR